MARGRASHALHPADTMPTCPTVCHVPRRKDVPAERVTHADREQTKKVVYSVVYGAGRLQPGLVSPQARPRWLCRAPVSKRGCALEGPHLAPAAVS